MINHAGKTVYAYAHVDDYYSPSGRPGGAGGAGAMTHVSVGNYVTGHGVCVDILVCYGSDASAMRVQV